MLNREDPNKSRIRSRVMVTATDPWGIKEIAATQSVDEQEVIITIDNVNEAPTITEGPPSQATHAEGSTDIDLDLIRKMYSHPPTWRLTKNLTDADGPCTCINWSLRGDDAGDLEIKRIATRGCSPSRTPPTSRSPADADMDNMYMVTVVATDSEENHRNARRGHHRHQRE